MNSASAVQERLIWLRKITNEPTTCTQIVPNGTKERGWVMRDIDFLLKEVKSLRIINKALHSENYRLRQKLDD